MTRATIIAALAAAAPLGHAGDPAPTHAYIIEGSGFFNVPGIEIGRLGRVNLSDPGNVTTLSRAADDLRFGGADVRPGTPTLGAFENTTNALRLLDPDADGTTLVDSTGFMDPGVAGMAYSNDGSTVYLTTTVGAFVRVLQVDADDASVISQHNILGDSVSSLAVVPEGHPTLTPGDLYGLSLQFGSVLRLVRIELGSNTFAESEFVSGIGFNPEFETGLDFAPDGTLYAVIQGFDEVAPDVFEEISAHLYTIDPSNGDATDLGVIQADQTWDAVTLVVDDAAPSACAADLDNSGALDFGDVSEFLALFAADDPAVDFDNSGSLDFGDVSAFLALFAQGCP